MQTTNKFKYYLLNKVIPVLLIMLVIGSVVSTIYGQAVEVSNTSKRLLPIYCVDTGGEKKIALSFDAAWGASDTDELIAIMEKHNVRATFFIVGDWARKYPDAVQKFAAAGHDIANHSDRHPHVTQMTKEAIIQDTKAAHEALKAITGKDCDLYRPPYGEYNNTVLEAAKECGYYTIQWDVDSLDWKEYGLEQLIDKVVNHKNLRPGSIILMHNDTKYTAKALDTILTQIEQKGYTFVPVSELILREEGCTLDHEGRQHLPASQN